MSTNMQRQEKILDITKRLSRDEYNKENLSYAINLCSKLLKNRMNKELEKEGITAAQFNILKDVAIHAKIDKLEDLTPVLIASRLDMDKPTISGIINRLVAKGYLEKFDNEQDKRSYLVNLTEKAKINMEEFSRINSEIIDLAISEIEIEKLRVFGDILIKMMMNLR